MTAQPNRILVSCECGKMFRVRAEFAGREAKCRHCQRSLTIPIPGPTDGSMDEVATSGPDLERPPLIDDHCHGEQRPDQKEPRTRSWRCLLVRFLSSLGLIGGGFLLAFVAMAWSFANINTPGNNNDLPEFLMLAATAVVVVF